MNINLIFYTILFISHFNLFSQAVADSSSAEIKDQLIDSWLIHNSINIYLLDNVKPSHLESYSASKGRNVGEQFAHIHNVRLQWIQEVSPELMKGLSKIEKNQAHDHELLRSSLSDSGNRISELLRKEIGSKNLKFRTSNPIIFLGYLISHESHHRGQIILSMKQAGNAVSQEVSYGIWDWESR